VAGCCTLQYSLVISCTASGIFYAQIYKNGTTLVPGSDRSIDLLAGDTASLDMFVDVGNVSAGDYFTVQIKHSGGSAAGDVVTGSTFNGHILGGGGGGGTSGTTICVLAANFSTGANEFQNVTGMSADVEAGETYVIECVCNIELLVDPAKLALGGTATISGGITIVHEVNILADSLDEPVHFYLPVRKTVWGDSGAVTADPPYGGGFLFWRISAAVTIDTAGTIVLRANTGPIDEYTPTRVLSKSYMRVTKV